MGTLYLKDAEIPCRKRIVFLGDSITDNGLYITFIESYFLQNKPDSELSFINLGVNSETVSGLSEEAHPWPRPCLFDRIHRALQESKPDWIVLCYGMNDGVYQPFSEERFQAYQDGIRSAVSIGKQYAEKLIVMTPPPYDHASKMVHAHSGMDAEESFSWKWPYPGYNEVLRRYADWILTLPSDGVSDAAINIFDPLLKDLEQVRGVQPDLVCGDGIHPNARGHWIMAKTLLRRLFAITLEREPDYVETPETVPWYGSVLQRHRLLSSAWKEHVGHTNPGKARALPLEEALVLAAALRRDIIAIAADISVQANPAGLKTSEWNGYPRLDFYYNGREVIVIQPVREAEGKPWVWRTEFFGAFDYADRVLLQQGWHIVYIRLSHMYGCPSALKTMEAFRSYVVAVFGLASGMALFGFSRGGLYAAGYALMYPGHVNVLYLDAPVLDIRSWPGGMGKGTGSPEQWEECLAIYGINEEEAAHTESHLLRNLERLAASKIPVLLIAGDADMTVPYEENGERFQRLYREAGGTIHVIVKEKVGHHPHSLASPDPIVEFIIEYTNQCF